MAETTSSTNMDVTTSSIPYQRKTAPYTPSSNYFKNIAIVSGVLALINIISSIIIISYFLLNKYKYIEIKTSPIHKNTETVNDYVRILTGIINILLIIIMLVITKEKDLNHLDSIEYKKYKKYYIGFLISSIITFIIIAIISFL
uniref:Uncharacterized protein n=1 Tax=viral metagenome TaxID=1070528 RepID=A0A6C0HW20_9ZZZZ